MMMTTNTTTMTTGMTTMTTEVVAEPRIVASGQVASGQVAKPRRTHAAAGSRTATLGLSVAATAGLVIAMVSGSAQPAVGVTEAGISTPVAELGVVAGSRPSIVLPVAADSVVTSGSRATVSRATPQPIVLQPQRRIVVKSNGSR